MKCARCETQTDSTIAAPDGWVCFPCERKDPYQVKHSGKSQIYGSGMNRDSDEGKVDYSLALDGPMFERLAVHLTKGAKAHGRRNWLKARTKEELDHFVTSAIRHMWQWYRGDTDEDHAAAVMFNIGGAELVKGRLAENEKVKP